MKPVARSWLLFALMSLPVLYSFLGADLAVRGSGRLITFLLAVPVLVLACVGGRAYRIRSVGLYLLLGWFALRIIFNLNGSIPFLVSITTAEELVYILFALAVISLTEPDQAEQQYAVLGLFVCIFLLISQVLFGLASWTRLGSHIWDQQLSGIARNANLAVSLYALFLPGCLLYAIRKNRKPFMIALVTIPGVLMTHSRGGLLTLVFLIILLVAALRGRRMFLPVVLLLGILLLLSLPFIGGRLMTLLDSNYLTNYQRVNLLKTSVVMASVRPFTGMGIWSPAYTYQAYQVGQKWDLHLHSLYPQMLVESGGVVLALYCAFLVWLAFSCYRRRSFILLGALICFLFFQLFDYTLWIAGIAFPYYVLLGLLLAQQTRGKKKAVKRYYFARGAVFVLILVTGVSLTLSYRASYALNHARRELTGGEPAAAAEWLTGAEASWSGHPYLWAYRAEAALKRGEPRAAMHYYRKAGEANPYDAYLLNNMAWLQYRLGDRPAALETLERARTIDHFDLYGPHILDTIYMLGEDRSEEGRVLREQAAHLYPGLLAYFWEQTRGETLAVQVPTYQSREGIIDILYRTDLLLKDFRSWSLEDLYRARDADPENYVYAKWIAERLLDQGNKAEALDFLREALLLRIHDDSYLIYMYGVCMEAEGESYRQRALTMKAERPAMYRGLARMLYPDCGGGPDSLRFWDLPSREDLEW